ncbi:hypothetical protein, partial [Anaerorhabdus sp.]|uniref:hypothetical protein n=1 Tax=Anaerorhabdus sp. TaxID=1872524 RepID=UPI002FC9B7D7
DKGFMMQKSWGITDNAALTNAYTKLLVNGITWEKNWELGNDVVLNYYYLDDDNKPVSLLTKDGNPLVKNKYWDGYLNYLDGTETKRLDAGTLIPMTYVGERMLSNRTWSTSTNPFTQTVSEGWLDAAQGHKVYVDIVVVYNNEIIKQTVSVDIPYKTKVVNEIEIENVAPIVEEENEIVQESVPSEEPIPTETTEPSMEPLESEVEIVEEIFE